MINFGCKGTLLCGEADYRLGVGSKSLHFVRGVASFRPLEARGLTKSTNAICTWPWCEGNGFSLNAVSSSLLAPALVGLRATRHDLVKCGRLPKKSQLLAQVGRGSLLTWAPQRGEGEVVPQGRGCTADGEVDAAGRRGGCRGWRWSGGSRPRVVSRGTKM